MATVDSGITGTKFRTLVVGFRINLNVKRKIYE
eukprot:SAG31_NODE_20731_length_566_cov_1.552463_1_plen_32_part_10